MSAKPFAIKYPQLEELADIQEKNRWREHEIRMNDDVLTWKTLDPKIQNFIEYVLSFSVVSDNLVNFNLINNFIDNTKLDDTSIRRFYLFQSVMEEVHARTYSKMLTSVITDSAKIDKLFNPDVNFPAIRAKIEYIQNWIYYEEENCTETKLVAFAIIEGIMFSSLFCAFYWLKMRGIKLSGMIQANEFISRDEGLHCDFALQVLNDVPLKQLPRIQTINKMVKEAVDVETMFVNESLKEPLPQINAPLMIQYVQYVADRLIVQIPTCEETRAPKLYNVENPFSWMESISIHTVANFFEKAPTSYTTSAGTTFSPDDKGFADEF